MIHSDEELIDYSGGKVCNAIWTIKENICTWSMVISICCEKINRKKRLKIESILVNWNKIAENSWKTLSLKLWNAVIEGMNNEGEFLFKLLTNKLEIS